MLRTESAPTGLAKYIPILGWLPRYRPAWLRVELLAGLVATAVVIPQAMAYASGAGLPVQVGPYTALVPMLLYSLLGTSRRLSLSTTSTIAIPTAATLAAAVRGGNPAEYMVPAATLALLGGPQPGTSKGRPILIPREKAGASECSSTWSKLLRPMRKRRASRCRRRNHDRVLAVLEQDLDQEGDPRFCGRRHG